MPGAARRARTQFDRLLHDRSAVLEEYYTLGLIAHGGINTNHVDGRTRAPATESSGAGGRSVLMWFDSWYELGRILAVGAGAYLTVVLVLRLSGKRTLATLNAFDLTAVSADCWRAAAPPR